MEASSPLAALHRPMPPPSWGSRDVYRHHSFTGPVASAAMSLREQLHKSTSDYFSTEPRGSSPAASLAADLSQNFCLDSEASPHFPTPRRALFTSNAGGFENRDYVTTPPLPSSSPVALTEYMELSPLPHKMPFSLQSVAASPTPSSTPGDEMMLDSPAPISRPSDIPRLLTFVDRKIAAPRRPFSGRLKSYASTGSRVELDGQPPALPAFRFGGDATRSSSNLSLGECFQTDSPPQEFKLTSSNSPCAPIPLGLRPRSNAILNGGASRTALPFNQHTRRQSNPFLRNRKQFRRSLSMYEHPADVMNAKPRTSDSIRSSLQSVMDIEQEYDPVVPHFMSDDPADTIPRITKETMLSILDGDYNDKFEHKMIIDCRFEYEYDGGHIQSAVNHNNKELLTSQLFQTPMSGRSLLIFHCEYSAHRAPMMARHVRAEDRTANAEFYPRLTYPEVYILDGGYSGFFSAFRARCFPQEYVEMSDEKHQRTCEREMGRLKARKAGGLSRAQTYAFGQNEDDVNDSPTGLTRPSLRQFPVIGSFSPVPERSHTRRMASY